MVDGRTVIGPLGRSVRDVRLGLSVIAGPDGRDPSMPPVARVADCSVSGLRIALHRDGGDASCHPAIAGAMDVVAATLRAAGAVVEERDVLDVRRAADVTRRYWRRAGLAPIDLERLLGDWDLCRTEAMLLLDDIDAIVSPAAPHLAPVIGEGSMADWTYTLAPSLWGWPAIAVPVGMADGLPYAAQVVAGPWREDIALAVAEVLEPLVTLPIAPCPNPWPRLGARNPLRVRPGPPAQSPGCSAQQSRHEVAVFLVADSRGPRNDSVSRGVFVDWLGRLRDGSSFDG